MKRLKLVIIQRNVSYYKVSFDLQLMKREFENKFKRLWTN